MKNITHLGWIKAKGLLFLFLATFSTAMLIADHFELRFILLFSIAVWSFCRFYYFAFYVITNYVDPTYKFSGLGSFTKYLLTKNQTPEERHMKSKTTQAFTLLELTVVIGLIAVIAAMLLPMQHGSKDKSVRIACINNQKQIGIAYRLWVGDGDKYPAQVPNANKNGGWSDFAKMTNAGPYCWSNYTLMQSELGQSPKILVCPADKRKPADDFKHLRNKNISYFMDPGASDNFPLSILGGDRNLAPGTNPQNDYGYSPEDGSGYDVILQTNSPICWSLKMHSAGNSIGAGNILISDGSVQQCSSARLMSDYQCNAVDAGVYPSGYINKSNSFRLVFP